MPDVSKWTFDSPFEPGTLCKAVAETSDGKAVSFHCPATGRDFLVSYEELAAGQPAKAEADPGKKAKA